LITKLESYTKDADDGVNSRAETATGSRGIRVGWDLALALCAAAYLALVLFDDVESPLLSMALIFLVAHALVQPHLRVGRPK
jgi:hypothetical protein